MIFAGVDVGSMSAEAVLFDGEKILSHATTVVKTNPMHSATIVMDKVLEECGLTLNDIAYCVSTGYGRGKIPFAQHDISEISCHGKGAFWVNPQIRTIIDIGAQDNKIISLDQNGEFRDFLMNDKCAAGTGRFLEIIARSFGMQVSDFGPMALKSTNPAPIKSNCPVYENFDAMAMFTAGWCKADIACGISNILAKKISIQVNRIGLVMQLCMTGGVANNQGIVSSLEHALGLQVQTLPVDPQIVGALGAAILASEKRQQLKTRKILEKSI